MKPWVRPSGILCLAGVDEVGRGPLAGDVVTAAVILPENHQIEGLAERIKLSQTDENGNLVERLKAKLNQALTTPYNTPWSLGDEELLKNHDALAREVGSLEDSRKVAKLGKETIKRFGNRLPEGLRKLGKGFGPLSILSALKQIEKEELLDRYEKEIRRRKLKKE